MLIYLWDIFCRLLKAKINIKVNRKVSIEVYLLIYKQLKFVFLSTK